MNKLVLAVLGLSLLAAPAFAAKHKVTHHAAHHVANPYIKHPNHKAHRHHHKKV